MKAFGRQFIKRVRSSDDNVRFNRDAQFFEIRDFGFDNLFRQAELRDAVHQHAARDMQRLEHRHVMPQFRQFARHRQARRPRADDRHALARRLRAFGNADVALLALIIRREPLQMADGDRFALRAKHALFLALLLLRANAAAHRRQGVVFVQNMRGV